MKKTILFTFGRSFLTLACARMMSAAGCRVITVDSVDFAITNYSNSVDRFYRVPSPSQHRDQYISQLAQIVKKEKVDLVVPMWEDLSYITPEKEAFPKECSLFCPDFNLYHTLVNKWTFQQLLEKHQLTCPKTFLVRSLDELKKIPFTTPYAFKPVYSRASQHIHKLSPQAPPPDVKILSHNPWVAQEWIEGKGYCTYSACKNGKLLAHSVYPVRYTVDGYCCISFEYTDHKNIHEWVENFVRKINYTGQIAFDFIETSDGKLYPIECNPRATSGLLLFNNKQGFERVFFGNPDEVIKPSTDARVQLMTGMAMFGWRKKCNYSKRFLGYLRDLFTTPDAVMSRHDWLPFLVQPYLFAQIFRGSRNAGLSIPNYFINDHIWDGR